MSVSILDTVLEEIRQGITGDDRYYQALPWVFRLVVENDSFKGPTGADGTALFPLPVAPEHFEYNLPFAAALTPQQESGVVVEEGGIVIGEITIGATTGFKLRKQQTLTFAPGGAQFTSLLGELGGYFQKVSGQMAWWLLANRCFEGYSQLKKDPETAYKTRLELHIMKEQLHLEVVPTTVRLHREAGRERVTYRYEIALKVIGAAKELKYEAASEKSLFQSIKDTISQIRDTVQSVKALVDDVTAALDELSRFISNIASIIDDVTSVLDAADDLVSGVKDFFDLPSRFLDSVSSLIGSAADLFEDTLSLPADVYQTFRQLEDQFDALKVAARDHFSRSWDTVVKKYNALSSPDNPATLASDYPDYQKAIETTATEASDANGGMSISNVFGGGIKPGDLKRQGLPLPEDRLDAKGYSGFEEKVVGQGDTLQSIAARFLGDARRWPELAMINGLRPPYLTSNSNIPGTIKVGAPIMVPTAKVAASSQVLTTAESPLGESQAEQHLGTDFLLIKTGKDKWGWKTDTAHGATDVEKVSGFANLGQALETRMHTVQGENILYPRVGLPRLEGVMQMKDTRGETALRVHQQLTADPRIQQLISFNLKVVDDAIVLEATVRPIGYSTTRVISRTLT